MNNDYLKDQSERLRAWLRFWQNIVTAIFVGSATIVYHYNLDKISTGKMVSFGFVLLTMLLIIAKIVIIIWNRQNSITEEMKEKK